MATKNNKWLEQYRDPRWQKKRLEIMERDEFACQMCSDSKSVLNVHHRYYTPTHKVWDYPNEALVTLCESCHSGEKVSMEEYTSLMVNTLKQKFFADDIRELASGFYKMPVFHQSDVMATIISFCLSDEDFISIMHNYYFNKLRERRTRDEGEKDNG